MGSGHVTPSLVNVARSGLARRTLIVLTLAFLAYKTFDYLLQSVLHFLDYTEVNWGRLWPNRFWLFVHMAGSATAMFFGPFQLWTGLRRRHLSIHRWTGRLYVSGVLVGGAAAFYLAFYIEPLSFGVALFGMGTAWWLTVGMAVVAIKQHRIGAHKAWMIRGYVITFAFVTFRLLIEWPIWSSLGPARLATVSWLSWIAPMLLMEIVLRWRDVGVRSRFTA